MTKLTNAMRSTIVNRIISKTSAPGEAKLLAREHALTIRMIRARFGVDVFERCRALPEGWLNAQKQFDIDYHWVQQLPRKRISTGVSRNRHESLYPGGTMRLTEYAPLPNSAGSGWTIEAVGKEIANEVHALFLDRVSLSENLDLLRRQITATLAAFTTVEKLATDWPEGYAELPAEMLAPLVEGLPAPRIADLNERITALREAA